LAARSARRALEEAAGTNAEHEYTAAVRDRASAREALDGTDQLAGVVADQRGRAV
jgi:hypothetical protein